MLHEIVAPRTMRADIGDHLPHDIKLVEAREDDAALGDGRFLAIPYDLFLLLLAAHEFLQDVEQAVLLQHVLPHIGRDVVAVLSLRVARTAVLPCPVRALIVRQEKGAPPVELRRHGCLIEVDGEECKNTVIQLESRLARVAVIHPLRLRVVDGLPRELVLQLDGDDRDAVDGEHHVDRIPVLLRVMPLADALADILPIAPHREVIERALRAEIADAELHAAMPESVPQH